MKSIGCEPDNLDPLERRFSWSAWGKKSGYKGDRMFCFGLASSWSNGAGRKDLTPKDASRRVPSRGPTGRDAYYTHPQIEPLGITSGIAQREKEGLGAGGGPVRDRSLVFGLWIMGLGTIGLRIFFRRVGVLRWDRISASLSFTVGSVRYFFVRARLPAPRFSSCMQQESRNIRRPYTSQRGSPVSIDLGSSWAGVGAR